MTENLDQIDAQELAEREEATQAYGREDEDWFVKFGEECVQASVEAMRDIRLEQQECWDVFNEKEPPNYARKEAWQSRVIVPKPYITVQFFLGVIRKAFDAEFLAIENEQEEEAAKFYQKLMSLMLSRAHANFPIRFTDATQMAGAIGTSMEMIPRWVPGQGLEYVLAAPWNIHRDPDAEARDSQSGMYWVHQEYLDYYVLKDGEDNGLYQNIPAMGPGTKWGDPKSNPNLTPEEINRRKDMVWHRSGSRSTVLTSEFWGTILDRRGELLLRNARYTWVGDRVIREPQASPYPSIRWPGTAFSPLPNLLRFDGRGLIQGIKSLWYFMNSLFCLHADNLNWIVNPPSEVDISALVDTTDVDNYPGKQYLTKGTVSGQQAFRTSDRRSQTGDILANMNFADQRFNDGTGMTYAMQGLPGYRAEVTARESAQNLDQSNLLVGLMGRNLEDGALNAIHAGAETVAINITYDELARLMGRDVADKYADPSVPTGLRLPKLNSGAFRVSGISALLKDQEILHGIRDIVLPLMEKGKYGGLFDPYVEPYRLCQALEKRLNLRDEKIFVDEDTAGRVAKSQQVQQEAAVQAQQAAQQAEAVLVEMKARSEEAKAEMNLAKAKEHEGKAELALAKAQTEGIPESEGPSAPPGDEFQGSLTLAETELTRRKAETEEARRLLTLAQTELALAQADATTHPPAAPAPKPATPASKEK
jgi:hypothetical protein